MDRRTFTRTALLGGLGAIFVPRYERWFRPLIVPPKPQAITFVGATLTPSWPTDIQPGDVAVLAVYAADRRAAIGTPAGWAMAQTHEHGAVYTKRVDRHEPPIRVANAGSAIVSVFRNAGGPEPARPTFQGIALATATPVGRNRG